MVEGKNDEDDAFLISLPLRVDEGRGGRKAPLVALGRCIIKAKGNRTKPCHEQGHISIVLIDVVETPPTGISFFLSPAAAD